MIVKKKESPTLPEMRGFIVSDLVFSLASDELTDTYSIAIKGENNSLRKKPFKDITEEEYQTIVKVFGLEEVAE